MSRIWATSSHRAPRCLPAAYSGLGFSLGWCTLRNPPPSLFACGCGLRRGTQAFEVCGDGLVRFLLVAFEREDLVGTGVLDEVGDVGMAAHGINGDDGFVELEFSKESRWSFQFIAFLRADLVTDAQARFADQGAQDMQCAFPRCGVLGPTADFPIDGDLFTRQITDPELYDFEQIVRP